MIYCYGYSLDIQIVTAFNNLLFLLFKMKIYYQSNLVLSTRYSCLSFEVVPVVYLSFVDLAWGKNQEFNHGPSAAGFCGRKVMCCGQE